MSWKGEGGIESSRSFPADRAPSLIFISTEFRKQTEMARHRQTREQAELKDAIRKNPQRYPGTPAKNHNPLPEPPRYLTAAAKKIWVELAGYAAPGVLTAADVEHMIQAVTMIEEFRELYKFNKSVPREIRKWEKELNRLSLERDAAQTKTEKTEIGRTIRKHMKLKPAIRPIPSSLRQNIMNTALPKIGMNPVDRQRINLPDGDGAVDDDDFETLH